MVVQFLGSTSLRSNEETALKAFLLDLNAATIYMLIYVMYLGRGDFDDTDLLDRYISMGQTFKTPKHAVRQMLEKRSLAENLQNGLTILAKSKFDVDEFMESRV